MSAIFSIASEQDFDTFATNLAKHTKLKPTHVRSAVAKTRGYQTVKSYTDALNKPSGSDIPATKALGILKQIEQAYETIRASLGYMKNDLDMLVEDMPIFGDNYTHSLAGGEGNDTLQLINHICTNSLRNYFERRGEGIFIKCEYLESDATGRNHYTNTLTANHNGDTVTFTAITVLEHDRDAWELLREQPISVRLNGKDITSIMNAEKACIENFDKLTQILCDDFAKGFVWKNPVKPAALAHARSVIDANQAALNALQSI
tara:strand:+ start:1971 stop:2753 length:783 start_codon:yes stop_codon:yes gene_type:complete